MLTEGVVVSSKVLVELLRLLKEEGSDSIGLRLSKDKNQILFLLPHVVVATRLIEGEYPAYEKIIPTGFVSKIVCGREEFLNAVKFAAVFAKEAANIIKIIFRKGEIVISARSLQTGENTTAIEANVEGEEGLSTRLLVEPLV